MLGFVAILCQTPGTCQNEVLPDFLYWETTGESGGWACLADDSSGPTSQPSIDDKITSTVGTGEEQG